MLQNLQFISEVDLYHIDNVEHVFDKGFKQRIVELIDSLALILDVLQILAILNKLLEALLQTRRGEVIQLNALITHHVIRFLRLA